MRSGIDLTQAETETRKPAQYWLALGGALQRGACQGLLDGHGFPFAVVSSDRRAELVLKVRGPGLSTAQMTPMGRGALLLDAEAMLRAEIDPAITVYLQPAQDKNALRKLRGVVVHDDRR